MSETRVRDTVVRVDSHYTGGNRWQNAWALLRWATARDRAQRGVRDYMVQPSSPGATTLEDVAAVKPHVRGLVVKYHFLKVVYNDPLFLHLYDRVLLEFQSPSQRWEFMRRLNQSQRESKGG